MDGLFNFATPATLQQNFMKDRVLNTEQMAQLPLLNQVAAMGGNTGSMLGNVVGRAFGGRSPEEARMEQMQGLLSNANTNDPEGLMSLSQRLQSINPVVAQELAQRAMNMRKTQVETQRIEAGMQSDQAKLLQDQQSYQMRFEGLKSRYPEMGDEEARALAQDPASFREIMKTPKVETQVVETAQGQILINKQTGQPIANIGRSPDRRQSTTNVFKTPADTVGLMKSYEDLTKTERATLQTVTQAKSLINEAATANNSVAWESARTQVAKAVGEGRLSNEDIRRTGTDPRLVQGALDWVNKKIEGVPNQDIQRQLFAVATLLERASIDKINQSSERVRASARAAGVPDTEMDTIFPKINVDRSPRRQPAGGAVNWSDLK